MTLCFQILLIDTHFLHFLFLGGYIISLAKPEPATNVDIRDITNTSFRIQFKPGYAGRPNHLNYQIRYAIFNGRGCLIDENLMDTTSRDYYTTDCLVDNILPSSHLAVWVRMVTDYGFSDSQPICIILKGR